MFINSLMLALSSSIDSLGIGITYGIKNTKISHIAKVVLFVISFLISLLSVWFGDILKNIFSDFATKLIGNLILISMGIFVCFQAICKDKKNVTQKVFPSEPIYENNEKIYSFFLFPLFISIFQIVFLSLGNMLGKKLHRLSHLPDNIWSVISIS